MLITKVQFWIIEISSYRFFNIFVQKFGIHPCKIWGNKHNAIIAIIE